MRGISVTIFIEDGLKGVKADWKTIVGETQETLRQQLSYVSACVLRQLARMGGIGGKDIGLYLEIYEVPPALEVFYQWAANPVANGQEKEMAWETHKTRTAWQKEEGKNGKAT